MVGVEGTYCVPIVPYLLCTYCTLLYLLYLLYPTNAHLPQGGSFTVAPIKRETLERQGNEEVVVLGRCTKTEFFTVGPV
jgi:hypothetical protein